MGFISYRFNSQTPKIAQLEIISLQRGDSKFSNRKKNEGDLNWSTRNIMVALRGS